MKKLKLLLKYIHYLWKGKNLHGVHSPFIYQLNEEVLNDRRHFYAFDQLDDLQKSLFKDDRIITVTDYGAGSHVHKTNKRKVKDIARSASKPPAYRQLLFRLVQYFQYEQILELGTSLGISTLYLALARKEAKVITLEGCPETAELARQHFKEYGGDNIEIITGEFVKTLPSALDKLQSPGLVYFDGNHKKEPTLAYFEKCLPHKNNITVFIFDDIHWSDEMEEAWKIIKDHPDVQVTVDLFYYGLVFFRKEHLEKEHFVLKIN